ncbi:hypothetical protein AVEN_195001-1 [Araneus ventricosus]|uniref:Uncharacterized protein n=1 Tax=Araneus ventricosus TaxID=182803 RepID=A0A4Y2HPG1_ARAVE|nr:hypothetical protein AVEN_195001-1 [Araneus ventricosus]
MQNRSQTALFPLIWSFGWSGDQALIAHGPFRAVESVEGPLLPKYSVSRRFQKKLHPRSKVKIKATVDSICDEEKTLMFPASKRALQTGPTTRQCKRLDSTRHLPFTTIERASNIWISAA